MKNETSLIELSNALADAVESAFEVWCGWRRAPGERTVFSNEGHVVAISHTVERDEDVEVGLADGRLVRGWSAVLQRRTSRSSRP
jgi:S1-C subfamily serine protease